MHYIDDSSSPYKSEFFRMTYELENGDQSWPIEAIYGKYDTTNAGAEQHIIAVA